MKMRAPLLIIFVLGCCLNVFSQRDLDLITLKNGTQLLGYIIEQQPGKSVTIFRHTINDTVTTKIEDIDKLSKILVQTFSKKSIEKKGGIIEKRDSIVKKDSISTGLFNKKGKGVQVAYMASMNVDILHGISAAYYKNFNNFYFAGVSGSFFNQNRKEGENGFIYDKSIVQFHLMSENKLRFTRNPQRKRLAVLIALNAGYAFNKSENYITPDIGTSSSVIYKEETMGNFMIQTNVCFKINMYQNAGFIIEPAGFTYYNPVIKQYTKDGEYLGYKRGNPLLITFRLGYFF